MNTDKISVWMQTFVEVPPESPYQFFHVKEGIGTTENPEATNIPIHNPYPNPPLHQPLIK